MRAATWTRLESFLLGQLDLATSTTSKTLRTLRFMERDGFPLHRPSSAAYNTFAAARKRAGATPNAMHHARKATRRLFLFHGKEPPMLRVPRAPRPQIHVLPDDQVRALIDYDVEDLQDEDDVDDVVLDQDELDTLRFCYAFGFYTALRPPSEHVRLQLHHFDDATGELSVYAPKTRRSDILQLEPWLAELVRAYIAGPRDRIAKRGERALLVNPQRAPRRGLAWTSESYRMWLKRNGVRRIKKFRCYDLRHAGLTWRAIQWNLDVMLVQHWARHAEISNTMRYIHVASKILRQRAAANQIQPLALSPREVAPRNFQPALS